MTFTDQRYYTATAGRFYTPDPSTGVDPKNPITWNKYTYAGDDPVNFSDPRGLMMDLVEEGEGGGFSDNWGFGADTGGLDGGGDFTGIGDKPGGGGSQGRGTVTAVRNLAHSAAVDAAFAQIRAAFAAGSDCENWFNAAFLTNSSTKIYGSLDNFLAAADTLTEAGTFIGGSANALTGGTILPVGVSIAVNTNGAFFNAIPAGGSLAPSDDFAAQFAAIKGNSDQARVFILLHELGHLLGMIRDNDAGTSGSLLTGS